MIIRLIAGIGLLLGAATLVAAFTSRSPATTWLQESVLYSGPRSAGHHSMICTDSRDADHWREIAVSAAVARTYAKGQPCPNGSLISDSSTTQ
jgi:hypothetical protein